VGVFVFTHIDQMEKAKIRTRVWRSGRRRSGRKENRGATKSRASDAVVVGGGWKIKPNRNRCALI